MDYGKIVNGELQIAGAYIKTADREYFNPSDEIKKGLGNLPIVYTDAPIKEGFYYTSSWQEIDGQIVRVWTEQAIPEPEPDPYETRLAALEAIIEAQAEALAALGVVV